MRSYSSKLSLVTGASSGIGKAIAADLASRGSNLILTARSKDRLEALAAELRAARRIKIEVMELDTRGQVRRAAAHYGAPPGNGAR